MTGRNPFDELSLRDLISEDGTTFNVGSEFTDIDEEYLYREKMTFTDEELLRVINMQEFFDDDDQVEEECDIPQSVGIHFDKIKEKMEDLTADGKVKKLIRQKGVGPVIPPDALVTIKYSGYFEGEDEPYDSSHARGNPDRYQLNDGQLIPGFELAIQSMKKHEISIFWVHPDYAFGELGCAPLIPPSAEIMYVISLIDYLDNASVNNFENLSIEEKKKFRNVKDNVAHIFKIAADGFKQRKYKQAIRDYKKIMNFLEEAELEGEEDQDEMKKLLTRAAQNLAICYNRENMPRQACIACNEAPYKTAKIHFHYGRALIKMGEYNQALSQLEKCLALNPGNISTIKEMELANRFAEKYEEIEKKMWSKCLGQSNETPQKENEYDQVATTFVKAFVDDEHIMRQPLPEGLLPEAEKAIRRQAAIKGLKVTSHTRYGKEIIYLSKMNYF
ncbi:inactive peptidyl-prolyl cis-trans isomerase FKBP6 [Diachasma alloeum]|uniref:inactive peptidyl-prolyl cis-trans isomerase FKBP6 n=1 Tax=Diachasma alloeum TaxID=454923 RepID=UPI0007384E87|nr:inactive peptidyl-prolyl cis-trans isomerase FKBP6 [Diachasma alloeum]